MGNISSIVCPGERLPSRDGGPPALTVTSLPSASSAQPQADVDGPNVPAAAAAPLLPSAGGRGSLQFIRTWSADLNEPFGLARSDRFLFVADAKNHRVLALVLDPLLPRPDVGWTLGWQFGSTGISGKPADSHRLNYPKGICYDSINDELFVCDCHNDRVVVLRGATGHFLRSITTWTDRKKVTHAFNEPEYCTVAPMSWLNSEQQALARKPNWLVVSEPRQHRVTVLDGGTGAYVRALGVKGVAGNGPGLLDGPAGVAIDGELLFVGDGNNKRVYVFNLGSGRFDREIWGFLSYPSGLSFDPVVRVLYVSQAFGDRVSCVSLLPGNTMDQVPCTFGTRGTGPAQLDGPFDCCCDPVHGIVFVSDRINRRIGVWAGFQR